MKRVSFLILVVTSCLSACSVASRAACEIYRDTGEMYSTMDSCMKCVDTLGPINREAIQGCAVGMDAAALLDLSRDDVAHPVEEQ